MTRALTPKGAATRARIVSGAADMVRSLGVARVGLEQIRLATGTSGSQLMHYFPGGKAQLLLAVAEYEAAQILEEQQPELGQLNSREAWARWAGKVFTHYERQGSRCALNALVSQLDPADSAVRQIIDDMYATWQAHLTRGFAALQAAHAYPPDEDPSRAASALLAGVQGGVVMMLATGSTAYLRSALDVGLRSVV